MDALLTIDGGVAALIVGALLGMVVLFIGGSWVRVLDGSAENPPDPSLRRKGQERRWGNVDQA